ncbi:hypothetical protein ANN_25701 [Periplaneta americana]|uniref:Uncharacterized protein n=1 Tax=Periplaneta americana TaxID=6978 RepID=A0ABQ8S440_PERAM|nr:hypothetical protein ANN_25701 [Periplaneta americana]
MTENRSKHVNKVAKDGVAVGDISFAYCSHTVRRTHLNAIDLARDRTRNLGHRRPALYQHANQVDMKVIMPVKCVRGPTPKVTQHLLTYWVEGKPRNKPQPAITGKLYCISILYYRVVQPRDQGAPVRIVTSALMNTDLLRGSSYRFLLFIICDDDDVWGKQFTNYVVCLHNERILYLMNFAVENTNL